MFHDLPRSGRPNKFSPNQTIQQPVKISEPSRSLDKNAEQVWLIYEGRRSVFFLWENVAAHLPNVWDRLRVGDVHAAKEPNAASQHKHHTATGHQDLGTLLSVIQPQSYLSIKCRMTAEAWLKLGHAPGQRSQAANLQHRNRVNILQ